MKSRSEKSVERPASMLHRPIGHLPKPSLRPHPFSAVDLQTEAAQFAATQDNLKHQASAKTPGVRPPKQAPPGHSPTTEVRLSRLERRHGVGVVDLSQPGLLRLDQVLVIFPVSRAAWYEGVKQGIYPSPIALGKRSMGYRTADVRALIASPSAFAKGLITE